MLNGFYVIYTGTTTDKVYTPEFPRAALSAEFLADVKLKSGSPVLVIGIEARNADETGYTEIATFSDISAVGLARKQTGALREFIRLYFKFSAGTAGDFYFLQLLPPQWLTE